MQQHQQQVIMQQQQQQQTEEQTPKIGNHCKRRYSDSSSRTASPVVDMDESTSSTSLDCQSLQRSLKRVRLSSSPGELRLQLDLRQLAQSHEWVQTAEEVWHWPRTKCRLEQCQVDPLRLVFFIPQQQHSGNMTRVWIQIPRMYPHPHRPPCVTQIQHAQPLHVLPHHHHCLVNNNIHAIRILTEAPRALGAGSNVPLEARLDGGILTLAPWTCILPLTDMLDFANRHVGFDIPAFTK